MLGGLLCTLGQILLVYTVVPLMVGQEAFRVKKVPLIPL